MTEPSQIITRDGRLYHLGITSEDVAGTVFLVGDPARAYKVAARFEAIEREVEHREYVTLTGRHRGLPMTVVGTGIGTDNVEIALIELHAARTMDLETRLPRDNVEPLDIIRIGTSGAVQDDVATGSLCVAEYALGLDSTGLYYESPAADEVVGAIERKSQRLLDEAIAEDSRFRGRIRTYASKANEDVHAALVRHAAAGVLASASGITASTSSFFGASSRYVEGLVNTVPDIKATLARLDVEGRRVLNMEMESSLLFHLAGALGHRAGTICAAIGARESPHGVVDYDASIEAAIGVAVAAALDLGPSVGD